MKHSAKPADHIASAIVGIAANNLADCTAVYATDHLDKRGTIADLEANVQTELTLGALADFDYLQCARNINGNRLFKVDVLARGDHDSRWRG